MKKIKFGLVLVVLFGLLSLSSCMENEKTQGNIDSEISEIYQLYLNNGGKLSYEEWLSSIKGEKGETGAQGPQGEKGDTGAQGPQGEKGDKGDTGEQGPVGPQGDQGQPGKDGVDGQTPFIGENGNWWIGDKDTGISVQGEQGPQGEKGDTGEQGVDGNGILRIEKTNTKDNVDTYTIYFTDGTTFEFTITNGKDGETSKSQGTFGLDYYPLDDGTLGVKVGKAQYLSIIVIPEEYEGIKVTQILDNAFDSCRNLISIEIPASVTSIGEFAFNGCSSLTNITIPESVTSIGDNAFFGCSSLTNITIPESVTSIGNSAFRGCSSLTSIEIPANVTSIGESAFYGCWRLVEVINKSSALEITKGSPNNGHIGYYALQIITDKKDSKLYTENDFVLYKESEDSIVLISYNGNATDIVVPSKVTSIKSNAFRVCSSLTSIEIPVSVTSIGDEAFRGCYRLVEVVNKSSLTIEKGSDSNGYIGYYALQIITDKKDSKLYTENDFVLYKESEDSTLLISYIGNATDIVVPSGVTSINGYAFYGCIYLTSIEIPASVTSIGGYAFYKCSSLTSIEIPAGVTSIGKYTFYGCSNLTSIEIPASVTSIGSYAFQSCSNLRNITYNGSKNQWQSITKNNDWNRDTGLYTIHCNDGDI